MTSQTHIRTDKDTLARLRSIAGDMPVTTYLREVVSKPGGVIPDTPLDALRKSILSRFDKIDKRLESIESDINEFDKTWFKSFLKHERDILWLSNMTGALRDTIESINSLPPGKRLDPETLRKNIIEAADVATDKEWARVLKEIDYKLRAGHEDKE